MRRAGPPPTSRGCHDKDMKLKADIIEGPEESARFDALVRRALAVPHAETGKPVSLLNCAISSGPPGARNLETGFTRFRFVGIPA